MRQGSERVAWAYLLTGVAIIALSLGMPENAKLAMLSLVQFSGGVAVLAGVWRFRPVHRAGWVLLGTGCVFLGAGAGVWLVYVAVLRRPIPYPGWSDAVFVPGYLAIAAGLAMMIRRRSPAREVQALLDALILSVGLAFANWVFLTGPASQRSELTMGQHILTIGYPLIDVLIVGLVARLLFTSGRLSKSLSMLAAGAVVLLGGDVAYGVLLRFDRYHIGALPDQLWMLSLVLVGTAALDPSMRQVAIGTESRRVGTTRLRLGFMIVAMLVPSFVVIVMMLGGGDSHSPALAVTTIVFLPLVAIRTLHLVQGLRRFAVADELTGLVNRDEVMDRLDRRRVGRAGDGAALLFIDLDHFKNVNDTLGHAAGDQVLVSVGERLRSLVREGDVLARLGGDEFVIVCEEMPTPEDAECLAERVVATLAEPFSVEGHTLFLGSSVGVVTVDSSPAEEILRNADVAMYAAKTEGRSRWVRFTPGMIETLADEVTLDTEFRQALVKEEFVLHYQPVVDLRSGLMVGAEALVRWQHPTRGLLSPAAFVPAAEQNDSITALGTWVLGEACRQGARWQLARPDRAPLTMAVNVSPRQLRPGLTDTVRAVLAATGLDPSLLHLEVTETALLDDLTEAGEVLAAVRELGVSIAIDDFGTGHASLTYLRRFAVDSVKIDVTFINGLGVNPGDTAIVKAVLGLADAFSVSVVAEGVENAEQLLLLRDMGCDMAQGYFLCRPVPAEQLADRLDADWLGAYTH
jgi:diguanylate cyclase (GGDEF)-like protein